MQTESKRQSNRRYDENKRNQESRRFYKSKAWQRCRRRVLVKHNYLCKRCLDNKRIVKADVVHHIKELIDYPELALDESNLESLCHKCHNRIHKKRETTAKKLNKNYVIEFEANQELL